jgi:hypothetical protein
METVRISARNKINQYVQSSIEIQTMNIRVEFDIDSDYPHLLRIA